MTWNLLEEFESTPGSIYLIGTAVQANHSFAVLNSDLVDDDVRQYGTLLLRIYNPFPVDEFMTVVSRNCYTRMEALFSPVSNFGTLNFQVGFYAPIKTIPQSITVWTEEL